jgi:glycosyltransferase involved in cell wall biosynthesis
MPTRVLHVYRTYFPDPQGGLQEAIRQIAVATRPKGVESTIFTLSPNREPRRLEMPEAAVVRCRSWWAPASCDIGLWDALRTFRGLVVRADLVHFHFPWPFADVLQVLGPVRRPAVMTYHSDIVRQKVLGALYRPLMMSTLRSMDAVVATSDAYRRTSETLRALPDPARVHVIPLGIAEETYRAPVEESRLIDVREQFGLEPGGYLFAIGVLRYYKGFDFLVRAARIARVPVVIAGDGPERPNLERLAASEGASYVRLLGHVTDAQKMALLRGCRAFVLASHVRSEAFGIALVEAAMMSRPMISCEIGTGTSYVNLDGTTGIVVPPADVSALASALVRLQRDAEAARQFGIAARRRYEALFSGEALGSAYEAIYGEVLARGPSP